MNAFFISCETTRNREIAGKPAAVAGDPKKRSGIILAANYEARKFGVKTAMVLHEALKLCPGMRILPPDHGFYERKSQEVMQLLSHYSPIIEQNSIDEAWLDMTGCESLFGKPLDAARRIMDRISSELGLWCSIGISYNKLLAKMASEIKKPMGITEIWEHDLETRLWPLSATLSFLPAIRKHSFLSILSYTLTSHHSYINIFGTVNIVIIITYFNTFYANLQVYATIYAKLFFLILNTIFKYYHYSYK